MTKCRKSFMPECEYFTTNGCVSPFNCPYKIENKSITTATSTPCNLYPLETDKDKEISRLQAENAELRERLEKAVGLPVRIGDPMWYVVKNAINPWIVSTSVTEITIYEDEIVVNLKNTPRRLVLDYNGEVIGNYYEIYLDKNSAEARLKELQGGER